jgi:hypothetical protein
MPVTAQKLLNEIYGNGGIIRIMIHGPNLPRSVLGTIRRRRTWLPAKSLGEMVTILDPVWIRHLKRQ